MEKLLSKFPLRKGTAMLLSQSRTAWNDQRGTESCQQHFSPPPQVINNNVQTIWFVEAPNVSWMSMSPSKPEGHKRMLRNWAETVILAAGPGLKYSIRINSLSLIAT